MRSLIGVWERWRLILRILAVVALGAVTLPAKPATGALTITARGTKTLRGTVTVLRV
jgi:uncharacterized protein (DUF2141 family)